MILHIIGGGAGQLSAIRRCKERGITTFVTDINPDSPGLNEADYGGIASTFDPEATIKAAADFQQTRGLKISALLVTGTDQPVLTAALTARSLGISYFLDEHGAMLVTNKKAMKQALAAAGIPTAPFCFIRPGFDEAELGSLSLPIVTKPLDSQGQRGVYRLESIAELRSRIDEVLSFSRCEQILVEEYFPSDEVTLSGWLTDGQLHILSLTDRVTVDNPPGIGICVAHHYPSKYSGRLPEFRELTERIVKAFGLTDGPLYFQYLIGRGDSKDQGKIILNETACRLGGAYEDQFIPHISGVDILDTMISFACRQDYNPDVFLMPRPDDCVISLQMFFCTEGVIKLQSGIDEVLELPDVTTGRFLLSPGTIVRKRLNSTQRAGYFIVCGNSRSSADDTVKKAYNLLRIDDGDGRNMIQFYDRMLFRGYK